MGAVSFSGLKTGVTDDGRRYKEATVTFSASYATGGDTVALGSLGLGEVRRIELVGLPTGGWQIEDVVTDPKAPKLKLQRRNDAGAVVEQTAAANSSTFSAKVRFIGS